MSPRRSLASTSHATSPYSRYRSIIQLTGDEHEDLVLTDEQSTSERMLHGSTYRVANGIYEY